MAELEKVIKGIDICLPRCHCGEDCPYYNAGCMEQLKEDALALLKAQEPKWISVKDRLPEHGKRYLIYATSEGGKNHRITTAAYGGHFALSGRCAYWKVTHWMPLPEPPKEET